MGLLHDGQWLDRWYDTDSSGGQFECQQSQFRGWVSASGAAEHPAAAGRYQLIVSLACPWAHRTLIFRQLKGLDKFIDVTVVKPLMLANGWEFDTPYLGHNYLYQLYLAADRDYHGRVTVPVLWDKQAETIVSNESAEIIRMFNSEFNELTGNRDDYYPAPLRAAVDSANEWVYRTINNGVYRAGFATTQAAYSQAYNELFDALDQLERVLASQRYLVGGQLTEADWRLFTTLIRFDAVYHGHFKCNRQRLADYPAISGYLRELYQYPGVAETVDFGHIKEHYYASHLSINPSQVVPIGPRLDFSLAHGREGLTA